MGALVSLVILNSQTRTCNSVMRAVEPQNPETTTKPWFFTRQHHEFRRLWTPLANLNRTLGTCIFECDQEISDKVISDNFNLHRLRNKWEANSSPQNSEHWVGKQHNETTRRMENEQLNSDEGEPNEQLYSDEGERDKDWRKALLTTPEHVSVLKALSTVCKEEPGRQSTANPN